MPWLLRCTPYDPVLPGERTLYFSDIGFMSKPTDTPADTYWKRRLEAPLDARTSLFSGSAIGGRSEVTYGAITLANDDGALDALADYDWDGRTVEVRYTAVERPVFADFSIVFSGAAERLVPGDTFSIELRDLQVLLDAPYQPLTFAGTGGAEGPAELAGRRKPMTLGVRRHVEPVQINGGLLIFAYGSGPSGGVLAAYDGGSPLVAGSNYASYAALAAATVAAGSYATCNALSLIRLGDQIGTVLTIDVEGVKPSGSVLKKFGDLAQYVITNATTLTSGDFATSTVSAMNTAAPDTLGHWYSGAQDATVRDVLDQLAQTHLAYYLVNATRKIEMGRFAAPKVTADFEFDEDDIFNIAPTRGERRLKRQTVRYGKRERLLSSSEVLGTIQGSTRDALLKEWQQEFDEDGAVATASLLATTETLDSALDIQAEALALAQNRISLFGPARRTMTATVPFTPGLTVGQTVRLQIARYGLGAGKNFVVLSLDPDASAKTHEMKVWG